MKAKKVSPPSPPSVQKGDDSDSDDDGAPSSSLRGYKLTADGKKTSFFNHEQTALERELIGDIRPKKIDSSSSGEGAGNTSSSSSSAPAGVSCWNKAGTWEERDLSSWGSSTLTSILSSVSCEAAGGGGTVKVTKVEVKDCTCSVATVRGRKRCLYDFDVVLSWSCGDGAGTVRLPEISNDSQGDREQVWDGRCDFREELMRNVEIALKRWDEAFKVKSE